MKKIYLLLFSSFFYLLGFADTPDFSMVGFATQNGGTTGGNSAATITDVYTGEQLIDAIGKEKTTTPRIIRVNGTIEYAGDIAIKNCANLTIFGADENAFISKATIIITNSSNIIIRNIKFTMIGRSGEHDILEITTTGSAVSQNIWIDHCEFYNETPTAAGANDSKTKDKYDELIGIKKNSAYITISWCYFHDHYKCILVGYSTDKDPEDRKITLHHNRFQRINSRVPSYRSGTAHIYNNYIEGWIEGDTRYGNAVHARDAGNLLVENNYFKDLNNAIYWDVNDSPTEGYAWGTGNVFDNVTKTMTTRPHSDPFMAPYEVNQDAPADLPALLEEYAGVGVITSYDDYGNVAAANNAPSVTITSPSTGDAFDAPADVTISANALDADGTIEKVEIYKGNDLIKTITGASCSYLAEGLMSGSHLYAVRAYDDKGKFTTEPVLISVTTPVLTPGESIFGSAAPENDYFWFGENASTISSMEGNVFLGTATFNAALDPQIDNKSVTTHIGGMSIPKEGGYIVFALPSCTTFELYMTRTGSFGGNVYASTDNINWSESLKSISGAKGILEFECSDEVTSASPIYIKVENTSSGSMNIHGANIRMAEGTTGCLKVEYDRELVSTKYFTLSGTEAIDLAPATIYIAVKTFDDGSVERSKVFKTKN